MSLKPGVVMMKVVLVVCEASFKAHSDNPAVS